MPRLRLLALEDRTVPAVATWDGGPDAGGISPDDRWATAANWAGDVAPQPGTGRRTSSSTPFLGRTG